MPWRMISSLEIFRSWPFVRPSVVGRENRFGKTLVLAHAVGQGHAAQLAATLLILAPCRTGQNAADNHLHAESLTLEAHRHHRVGRRQFPVGTNVRGRVEKFGRNLVEHLSLVGNTLGQNHVKSGDPVGGHHDNQVVVDVVHVAHLTVIHAFLSFEMKICLR